MINIVLIQHDKHDRENLSELISVQRDLEILGTGEDSYDAIMLVKKHRPDIVILDCLQDTDDEMEISCILKRYSPSTTIVFICTGIKDSLIRKIINGNITDCLLRGADMIHLIRIIREIHKGEHYINPMVTARALQVMTGTGRKESGPAGLNENNSCILPDFSKTEIRILCLVAKGCSGKDIARSLSYKDGTIRNYISSLIHKTGMKNRSQLILYAQKNVIGKEKTPHGIFPANKLARPA